MSKGVALITGGSRGIGRGIVLELAQRGYDIIVGCTRIDPSQRSKGPLEVKSKVEALGRECLVVTGDIGDPQSHAAMVDAALERFGRIDVLVNNAGVAPLERRDVLECSEESYDRVMGINLRGPFFFTQAVASQMVKQVEAGCERAPRIIFITSISSNTASPNRAEYCLSKAGLSMAAQNFAVRLAEYGINVYDVQPGITATDMTAGVQAKYDALIDAGLLLNKRWGTPKDVGKAVVALAEGYFDYATGAVIEIGGGFGVKRL
jgi:3-oxoacyl-[acyl-carrier protein] reductase